MTPANDATTRQNQAARPDRSTWLSANAGSGKTRVLTDRVARLLLDGTAPQNILCLTYTKAAASEMQNRLFKTLGAWAMTPDADLRDRLGALGVGGALDGGRLTRARTLFARAIETPGGLKIQTIHAFCAGLLRRFPLEAGVSPQFTEMDDRAADLLAAEIVEEMADTLAPGTIATLAEVYTGEDLSDLVREVARHRDAFAPPRARAEIFAAFGIAPETDAGAILAAVFVGGEADLIADLLPALRAGSTNDAKAAGKLAAVSLATPGLASLEALEGILLTGATAKEPFCAKIGSFPTKATREVLAAWMPRLDALMARVEQARARRIAWAAAEKTDALHRFAAAFLPLYAARKQMRGWLDFEDLILKVRDLMRDPDVADWVLFRLDGGIDHILVDEAQDTSHTQWQVIEHLAREFTAGDGRRAAGDRSLFVVGDIKQSIYSFQGADPEAFERMHGHFAARLADVAPLQRLELEHSFRSSGAILEAVDAVFGQGGTGPMDLAARHRAFHTALPGRVDLWPLLEAEDDPEDCVWYDPVDRLSPNATEVRLADLIAGEIRRMIDAGETIPQPDGTRRAFREGDVLILVQRRRRLFAEIIRACKQRGLAIAGADRLKLGAELAVRDIQALLSFLALPEDDLSLAAALRSPLFGWGEGALYDLAQGRGGDDLWSVLRARRDDHPETMRRLDALRSDADFLRPYDLIERILLRHGGGERLLARLGHEAQDGLDELLNQALAYERSDVPSLTGFLAWLDAGDTEVRRQAEGAGDRIRVMSVHGAKGLEAPMVILPDTLVARRDLRRQLFPDPDLGMVWRTAADATPPRLQAIRAELVARDEAERARLLYVAMTRAETWLIVCGAGKAAKGTWYAQIEAALAGLGTTAHGFPAGHGVRLAHGAWDSGLRAEATAAKAALPPLPDWIARPAPAAPEPPALLSPSRIGGAKALPGEGPGLSEDEALARGTRVHLLLETLPDFPETDWPGIARNLLGDALADALLPEARRVLGDPDLAFLFAPGTLAEVDLAAPQPDPGAPRIFGTVDRLIVGSARVLAVDFKTNATVPTAAETVPDGLLAQMGSYRTALAAIFPDREIDTAILWTASARLMPLPGPLVDAALQRLGAT